MIVMEVLFREQKGGYPWWELLYTKNLVIMSETLDDLLNELNYFVPSQAHLTFQAELGLGIPYVWKKLGEGL